jgi:hypothetical protein
MCEPLGYVYGTRRWRDRVKGRIYTWDALHGEIEGFDRFGRHCGVFDPLDGREIKPAIKGRRIDV